MKHAGWSPLCNSQWLLLKCVGRHWRCYGWGRVNLPCQSDQIWTQLGDTPLRCAGEGGYRQLNRGRKIYPKCEWHHPMGRVVWAGEKWTEHQRSPLCVLTAYAMWPHTSCGHMLLCKSPRHSFLGWVTFPRYFVMAMRKIIQWVKRQLVGLTQCAW